MNKLFAVIPLLFLAALADNADAGWTHKMSAYSSPMKASTRGVATVTLETPADYTLDAESPPTISVITPEGVTLKDVYRAPKSAGMSAETAAAFEIVLSASKKGKHTLAAEVEFSICAGQSCAPKTERISFDVVVE